MGNIHEKYQTYLFELLFQLVIRFLQLFKTSASYNTSNIPRNRKRLKNAHKQQHSNVASKLGTLSSHHRIKTTRWIKHYIVVKPRGTLLMITEHSQLNLFIFGGFYFQLFHECYLYYMKFLMN